MTFTAAAFGTAVVSESAVAAAVRLVEPGAAVPPALTQLTTEVLHMTTPKWPRVAVLVACGLFGVAGAVGLLPGNGSPVAPPAVAAPVPALTADKRKELDDAWNGLSADPQTQTRAIVRLAAHPKATTAYLKERFRPVTVSEEVAKKTLADLASDDEKTWQTAYRTIQFHDPRLELSVPDVWVAVKSDVGRHRLYLGLLTNLPADHPHVVRETWYTYSDPVEDANYPDWYRVKCGPTADAPRNIARVQDDKSVPGKPANFYRPEWERADRLITLLEGFGTPDAVVVLEQVATGHPDAAPTKSAKEVLGRLKKK